MNAPREYKVVQPWEPSVFGDPDHLKWAATTVSPGTLRLSDIHFPQNSEWIHIGSDIFQMEGKTTKEVTIVYDGKMYVQPVGAKIVIQQQKNSGKYRATFLDAPHLQGGGKRRSTKNSRRRARLTRKNGSNRRR